MNTADSLASGALAAAIAALAWLTAHSAQIRRILELLPTLAADASKAKAALDGGGLGQAVTRVEAKLDDEARALLHQVVAALESHAATPPASTPAAPAPASTPTTTTGA